MNTFINRSLWCVCLAGLGLLLASCSGSSKTLSGYIEGQYTYISSTSSGVLFRLAVQRGQPVKQGELLYVLDPQPEQDSVNITKADIANLKVQIAFSQIEWERQKKLFLKNAASQESVDQARTTLESQIQQFNADQAQLIQNQWKLQQKTRYAPADGRIFDTFYRVGETVPEHQPVLALLTPDNIKVLFYVPETLLSQITLGEKITFTCDSCHEKTEATIEYISPEAEYTPPVIYSKDTRYKLVYLIRARIPLNKALDYHPGQPIDVTLSL